MGRILLSLVAVCAAVTALFALEIKAAENYLENSLMRVEISSTRFFFGEKSSEVELAVFSPRRMEAAKLQLELVTPDDEIKIKIERDFTLNQGLNKIRLPLELGTKDLSGDNLLWNRVRYQISAPANAAESLTGVISLSEITPDLFEVRVAAADNSIEGSRYSVRVRAAHPLTNQPAKDVRVAATLELELDDNENDNSEDDKATLTAAAKTNAEGFAIFNFDVPANRKIEDGEIKIRAERGGAVREEESDVDFDENRATIYISSDKPLYQPGQSLNIRGLLLNRMQRVVPNAELKVEIKDEEGEKIYTAKMTTSRFGIASMNWQIPENAKLGNYEINIEDEDDNYVGAHLIKISRYDLPNFTVAAKPNQTYYLPDQNAEIEIRADYLFGKPVTNAKVRLVRETNRRWDYREQKWDIEEAEKFEGTLDASGKFIAAVDLTALHKDLAESDWQRHRDLSFTAYVTDVSTNKTEQRRFDVRLTKEAIHVYLIGDTYNQNPTLPGQFYVSTFYADGTPAACDVAISDSNAETANGNAPVLLQTKSNSYGAAKLQFAPFAAEDKRLNLKIVARDAAGKTGTHSEEIYLDADEDVLQIETDKTIYRRGESLKVNLASTVADALVYLDVMRGSSVVRSESVRLKDGRGTIKIPYNAELRNDLTITAYTEIPSTDNNNSYNYNALIKAARTVIYPAKRELQVDVKPSAAVYRPGETAKIDFSVAKANGQREESALGVVVFDKAVEERARTDSEFGGGSSQYGNYYGLLYGRSFGSLSQGDLDKLDMRRAIAPDLELAAEVLLHSNNYFYPDFFGGDFYTRRAHNVFAGWLDKQMRPVREKLQTRFDKTYEHPSDESSLKKILSASKIDFDTLRDPWNTPYEVKFTIVRETDVLELISAGADQKFGTNDDFTAFSQSWNYFKQIGDKINAAVAAHHQRTGGFVRDANALQTELRQQGVELENLRDRWGKQYRVEFDAERADFLIRLTSGGANAQFEKDNFNNDDFTIWTNRINYFADAQTKIDRFLSSQISSGKPYPKDEAEFKNMLRQAGVEFDALRDGWNQPFVLTRQTRSYFTDRIKIESVAKYGEKPQDKTTLTPITQELVTYRIHSRGADGKENTVDDFDAAVFNGIVSEQTKDNEKPQSVKTQNIASAGRGAVTGVVTDPVGAVVPGAKVTATNILTTEILETTSDEEGEFLLKNLPSGLYKIKVESPGFQNSIFEDVPVRSANLTTINFNLQPASAYSTVEVTVNAQQIESLPTANRSSFGFVKLQPGTASAEKQNSVSLAEQIDTPRLREYFPETLVWQPELITGKNGRAELKFKLADSLTTWKMAVIGSTLDGEVGLVEKEFQAFMPFFAEHDPPKILTVGDQIALPVVLRNYLDKPQTVTATMANTDWFKLLGDSTQKIIVAPNAASNAVFDFAVVAPVKTGKQRVTAIGSDASDAIEKPVTVLPDGREISKTQGTVFNESATFDVNFPADIVAGTGKAELKIYPNLMSHIVESVEGILQRPYGCGEQTISSTYPNLLVLKATKNGAESDLKKQAQKYLRLGYERLIGYKAAGGGFTYWGKGEADLALTAYALRFLVDAQEFTAVDADVTDETRDWLIKQQSADGGWKKYSDSSDVNLTAYLAKTLSRLEREEKTDAALQNALRYLQKETVKIDEPYVLANFALTLFNAGKNKEALIIAEKLRGLAKKEAAGTYWNLETNTPFNGWGRTGRIETTALVLQALTRAAEIENQTPAAQNLIAGGVQFLFKQKDRYGVWDSTQTTVNVLDTMIMLVGTPQSGGQNAAAIFVNGQKAQEIAYPVAELSYPLTVDLTKFLTAANNRVEIRPLGGINTASAQVVQNYYVKWNDAKADSNFRTSDTNGLRLTVDFDKTTAQISEEITCRVAVQRTGYNGYGMLLAEIGLPPGADVDRQSIADAMQANYNISRYDILPNKLVVYLWAQAGGTNFNFKFKPRYGINAQTAASTAYDYYNPEAQATLAPVKFVVQK